MNRQSENRGDDGTLEEAPVLRREVGSRGGMIAAAFYPNPVVIRMSDFKTNEYANLLGGTV